MRIGFLITARLKSKRLRLKLLKYLNGYTIIERVIQRAKKVSECDDIILCTSRSNQDLPLIRIAKKNDIYYYNGDSDDVLKRLHDAALLYNLDYIVGITADNPLFSIRYSNIISDMIRYDQSIDYICSINNPIGMNVYAVKTKALQVVCEFKNEMDTEIWGRFINRPEIFNTMELETSEEDIVGIDRLTIDEAEDYLLFSEIFNSFDKDYLIEENDLKKIFYHHPELMKINESVSQYTLDKKMIKRIDDYYRENHSVIVDIKNRIYGF